MAKRFAYFVSEMEKDENGEFIALYANEEEKGYRKTDWRWGKDIDLAEKAAARKNSLMGITTDEAHRIVVSTM